MSAGSARGYLYLTGAMILWSTAELVTRTIHTEIGPVLLAWTRFTLGGILLGALTPRELRRRQLRLNRHILIVAAGLGSIGIVLCGLSFNYALTYAGAAVVATVFGATPLVAFILSRIFLGDQMTGSRLVGVLLGFTGILVLALSKQSPTFSLIGFSLAFFNIACFALYTVLVKKLAGPFAGLPITALCFGFGSLEMLPIVFWEGDTTVFGHLDALWAPMLYLSLGTTGLAHWFYFMGLEQVDATSAVSIILLKPPLAALLAFLVLGEPLTWNLLTALTLILGGLYLVNIIHRYQLKKLAQAVP